LGGLLSNARKFFKGLAPAIPARAQTFSVACPEGHRLTGQRTEGYQSLRCPTCGEGIFVLPRSPLPEPVAPATATPTKPRSRATPAALEYDDGPVALTDPLPAQATEDLPGGEADGEIEWVDESGAEAPAVAKARPEDLAQEEIDERARASGRATARQDTQARKTAGDRPHRTRRREAPPAEEAAEPEPEWVPLAERFRRHRNPLIFLAVALMVVATVAIRTWRTRRQDLPRVAELGRTEGLPALDAGKFDRAYQLLSEAKRAVLALGDAYQGAEAIKQGADEAAVIKQLVPNKLEDLLDEAARDEPKEWQKSFDTLYKGRTVIVDAYVTAVPDGLGSGRYELDYRIVPPGGDGGTPRSIGQIDLGGFRLLELTKPKKGDRVTFGARLASFRFDLERERWLVGLDPESGVIMTHAKALEALGWPSSADGAPSEDQP
jgi:hypothetical protein